MMKKILKTSLLLLCLSLASCGQETDDKQEQGQTVTVTREIKLSVLPIKSVGDASTRSDSGKAEEGESVHVNYGAESDTRAESPVSETAFYNGYVLVCYGASDPLEKKIPLTREQFYGKVPITCTLNLKAGQVYAMYVVVNIPSVLESKLVVGASMVDNLANTIIPHSVSSTLPQGMFMYGHSIFTLDSESLIELKLKPCLAKLKVDLPSGATMKLKNIPSGYTQVTSKNKGPSSPIRPSGITYDATGVTLTSGTTYYVPENLGGRNDLLIKNYTRTLGLAPDNKAMYVEVIDGSTTYDLLLGDGSASDFNVAAGYAYALKVTLGGTNTYDLRVNKQMQTAPVDLSSDGTANCYIAAAANTWYMFNNIVMGNGATTPAHTASDDVLGDLNFPAITPSKLNPAGAEVLWESANRITAPTAGSIVGNNVYLLKDRILFKSGSTEGNAVIAAKDASNNIIWSWHIWRVAGVDYFILATITDYYLGFTTPTLKMMDRNLGALRATPDSRLAIEKDYGLYYQWGRKDPFQTQGTVSTAASSTGITPAYAVKNPTTFFTNSVLPGDWTTRNDNLWGCPLTMYITVNTDRFNRNAGSKSIYDPCPVGWRVPPAYAFANATQSNSPWAGTDDNAGRDFVQIAFSASGPFFLPASGARSSSDGRTFNTLSDGYYWTSSPGLNTIYGGMLSFDDYEMHTADYTNRAHGHPVRCVQE